MLANLRDSGTRPEETGDTESGVNGRCTPEGEGEVSRRSSPGGKYFSLAGANPNRGSTK